MINRLAKRFSHPKLVLRFDLVQTLNRPISLVPVYFGVMVWTEWNKIVVAIPLIRLQ